MMIASRPLLNLNIFQGISLPGHHILFHSNGPAIWHSFPDITHIKVNNGSKASILNLIELAFFQVISLHVTAHFVVW